MQVRIAPSLLSADFLNLKDDIRMLNECADIAHLDIMDGVMVPNLSFGFSVLDAAVHEFTIPTDAHLMIIDPRNYVDRIAELGVDYCSFHLEAARKTGFDAVEMLRTIKKLGMKAGLAFNPDIPAEDVYPYIPECDFIVVMSVFAGFGGQNFHPECIDKIKQLKLEIIRTGSKCEIEVDGGVSPANSHVLIEAGADILVSGSFIFKATDKLSAINSLRY